MAFFPNDPDDLVLEFCLENGIRDIPGINYMLYKYAIRPLEESVEQGETGMFQHLLFPKIRKKNGMLPRKQPQSTSRRSRAYCLNYG